MEGSSGTTKGKKAAPSYRRGKWTAEEEAYSSRLITEFKLGLLPLTDGTTLRTFLSKLLNCDPMRISKKFVGQNCIGKQVFRRRQLDIDLLTPEELDRKKREISELEKRFLERVAQTNRAQRNERNGGLLNKGGRLGSFISEDGRAPPWMVPPSSGVAGPGPGPGPGEIKTEGGGVAAASSKPPAQKAHMRSATWNPHPHLHSHSHSHSHSREMMPSHQFHHSQPSPSFGEVGVGAFADLTPAGLPPMSSSTSADWGYFPGSASGQAVNPGNFGENYLYYETSQGQRSAAGGGGGEGTAGATSGAASMGGSGSSSCMYRVTSLDLLRAALGEHEGEGMGDNTAENSNSLFREKPMNPCGKTKRRVTGEGDGSGSVERHGFRAGIEYENEHEHEGASGATSSKSRSTSPSTNGALPPADDERQKKAPRGTRSNADNSSGDATSNADSSSVHSVHSGKTNMGCADSLAPPASSSSFTTGWVGAGPGPGPGAGASNITPGFGRASGFVSLTQPHLDMHEKRIAEEKEMRSGSTGAGMGGEGVGVEPKAAGAAMPMPMQVQYVPSAPPGFEGLKRNSSIENFWLLVNMGDLPKPDSNTLTESFEGDNPASAAAAPTGPGSTRAAAAAAAAASSAALSTLSEAALAAGGGPDALTTHDSYAEYQQQMIIQQYRMQKQLQTDPCLNSMYDNFSSSNGGVGGGEWNRPG